MRDPSRIHSSAIGIMSLAMVVIGIALIVRTIAAGGAVFSTGILLGVLFVFGGGLRLYVQTRGRAG